MGDDLSAAGHCPLTSRNPRRSYISSDRRPVDNLALAKPRHIYLFWSIFAARLTSCHGELWTCQKCLYGPGLIARTLEVAGQQGTKPHVMLEGHSAEGHSGIRDAGLRIDGFKVTDRFDG